VQHLQPGTTLQGGKYRIERVLGQGGLAIENKMINFANDMNKKQVIKLF
jgi:hypothetical protein